jgi:hypothetical protein
MRIPYSFCVLCSEITFSASYLNVMFQNDRGWILCMKKPQPVWVKFHCTSWSRLSNLIRISSEFWKKFGFKMCVTYWKCSCLASLKWSGLRCTWCIMLSVAHMFLLRCCHIFWSAKTNSYYECSLPNQICMQLPFHSSVATGKLIRGSQVCNTWRFIQHVVMLTVHCVRM